MNASWGQKTTLLGGVILVSGLFNHSIAGEIPRIRVEAYPDAVVASREIYRRQLANAATEVTAVPYYLVVPKLQRWSPGQKIRVAFNGGSSALREDIAEAASTWISSGGGNVELVFKDAAGKFLTWDSSDQTYAAEIRISFASGKLGGYWSHVGKDSVNSSLIGGAPGQASMNFDSFDIQLPTDWATVVVHEFGHALGFQHEHQHPEGGCDFRFDDDPEYVLTKNEAGWYVNDSKGRRPGLYTFLGGHSNYWPKATVDHNLGVIQTSSAYLVGDFDVDSVMKYFFDASMFKTGEASPCYSPSDNASLSQGDIQGVRKAYPSLPSSVSALVEEKGSLLKQLEKTKFPSEPVMHEVRNQLEALRRID